MNNFSKYPPDILRTGETNVPLQQLKSWRPTSGGSDLSKAAGYNGSLVTSAATKAFRRRGIRSAFARQPQFPGTVKSNTRTSIMKPPVNKSKTNATPVLTHAEKALVTELVEDGLSIQHKFHPEPLYKQTGKGVYRARTVTEIRRAKKKL